MLFSSALASSSLLLSTTGDSSFCFLASRSSMLSLVGASRLSPGEASSVLETFSSSSSCFSGVDPAASLVASSSFSIEDSVTVNASVVLTSLPLFVTSSSTMIYVWNRSRKLIKSRWSTSSILPLKKGLSRSIIWTYLIIGFSSCNYNFLLSICHGFSWYYNEITWNNNTIDFILKMKLWSESKTTKRKNDHFKALHRYYPLCRTLHK